MEYSTANMDLTEGLLLISKKNLTYFTLPGYLFLLESTRGY